MRTILVVDDEEPLRTLVSVTLGSEGCRILEAGDAEEAFRMALEHRPDVVLLDIVIPGGSGVDVCRQIKGEPSLVGTKVVMLTAMARDASREMAQEAGADAYVTKPFSPLALLDLVDRFVEEVLSDMPLP